MTITYDSVRSEEWKDYLSQFSGREDLQVRSGQADSSKKIFPDEIHQTCDPVALTRALMFLYEKP